MRQFQAGEIIAGKYRLQHPLAKGGMGAVWTAWNDQLEVPVAVKFMSAEALGSTELIARFEREAKAAAQMRSPQVVQIYEHGVFSGVPFMVMELLEGEDLGKRLRTRGRLPLPEIARIGAEVCKALRRAHELGIVHRDLKPANVFLARSGDDEVVKVLDFGIAKLLAGDAAEATKTGALIGTPNYMSPEQARRTNRQVDHRSDLWSLGVIAFRAVTGKLPFAGDDPVDILVRICTTAAPSASSIAPDVGPEVDRFFARALAFDPDHRFQNARDFADAMNALAANPARQPSLGQSWGGEIPVSRASSPGPARLVSQPAYSAPPASPRDVPQSPPRDVPQSSPRDVQSPPRNASPGPRSSGGPFPVHSPHPAPLDPLDTAATVPIQRSPVGQALLAGAPSAPGPVSSSPQGGGMSRMASSPHGAAPAPASPPAQGGPSLLHGQTAPLPLAVAAAAPTPPLGSSGSSWQGEAGAPGGRMLKTLPLGTPAAPNLPRPPLASMPEAQSAATPSLVPAAATTSAGESAGTITSATGELAGPAPRRRTSFVVWGALAAALVVILVVGSVVVTSMSAQPEPEVAIPLPPSIAFTLRVDPSESPTTVPSVTPQPVEVVLEEPPSPSSTAAAAAPTASASAAAPPSTTAKVATPSTAKPAAGPKPKPAPTKDSAIFATPVFGGP